MALKLRGLKLKWLTVMSKNFYQKKAHLMSISGPVLFTPEQRSLAEVGLSTANVALQSNIALPNP
ncbi:hypothetical protein F3J37_21585 [Pantoea sp. Al-1710]|uniref:Uncharacterized protein n=1 Tax=Candidatus Pantoea communis TaxID=2608354 RepID=A0ABX0RUK9_9GAMM|nr:hypothetical protein [Pantoea communis]NIG21270.1 hypothetical protein [Pantoea communis]